MYTSVSLSSEPSDEPHHITHHLESDIWHSRGRTLVHGLDGQREEGKKLVYIFGVTDGRRQADPAIVHGTECTYACGQSRRS